VYEGGVRAEGFLAGPALRRLVDQSRADYFGLMHAVDWLPTLTSMVGANPNGKKILDGIDQLKALQSSNTMATARNGLFLGYSMSPKQVAMCGFDNEGGGRRHRNRSLRRLSLARVGSNETSSTIDERSARQLMLLVSNQPCARRSTTAYRWKSWKLVRLSDRDAYELYHLGNDPGETKDVRAANPAVFRSLHAKMIQSENQIRLNSAELLDKACPKFELGKTSWGQAALAPWC